MKRVTKSVTALLLALVLSLTLLPAQALAADTAPATQTYTGTAYVGAHTNPVYARVWKGVAETSLQTARRHRPRSPHRQWIISQKQKRSRRFASRW